MKKLLLALATILLATLPTVGCTSEKVASATKPSVVSIESPVDGKPICTGVAIGKNLVWTKAHCMVMPGLRYNGKSCTTDKIVADDGFDNVLVATCQSYTKLAKAARRSAVVGESVYFWGYFGRLPALYRVGHVAGVIDGLEIREQTGDVFVFDFQGTGGDSGGPVFNSRGEVLCTLKGGIMDKLPYCVPHHFTKDQLKGKF